MGLLGLIAAFLVIKPVKNRSIASKSHLNGLQEIRESRFSSGVVAFLKTPEVRDPFFKKDLQYGSLERLWDPGGAPGRRREVEVDQLFAPRRSQASPPSAVRCASGTGFAHPRWLGGRFGRERAYWIRTLSRLGSKGTSRSSKSTK